MSTLRELLRKLTGFLKPTMDRDVEDPMFRMHHAGTRLLWRLIGPTSRKPEATRKLFLFRKNKMAADFPAKRRGDKGTSRGTNVCGRNGDWHTSNDWQLLGLQHQSLMSS